MRNPPYNTNNPKIYQPPGSSGMERPYVAEDTLKTAEVQVERKKFIFTLKENPRGRFLRITEEVSGKRNNIIIPSTGLEDFGKILGGMVEESKNIKGGPIDPPQP